MSEPFKKPRAQCGECLKQVSVTARGGLAGHHCKHGFVCVEANSGRPANLCARCDIVRGDPKARRLEQAYFLGKRDALYGASRQLRLDAKALMKSQEPYNRTRSEERNAVADELRTDARRNYRP